MTSEASKPYIWVTLKRARKSLLKENLGFRNKAAVDVLHLETDSSRIVWDA
jgi:hypothetical protein